jgi:hypothetical protein
MTPTTKNVMREREEGMANEVSVREAGQRHIAHLVSQLTNPGFVALPTFLAVALHTAPTVSSALLWWLVTTIGISIAPLLYVSLGVRAGRYSDHHLSLREERLIPFVVGLVSTGGALTLLLLSHASAAFLATVTAVLVGAALALAITHGAHWKISLHVSGIAGAVTVLTLLFGWPALLLTPLLPLVGWARWRLGAHTIAQATVAMLIAVAVTGLAFRLFGVG